MRRALPCVLALWLSAGAQAQIQRVAWLAGCWSLTDGERSVDEHWMAPRAGSMQGMSRTVRGDKLVAYESVLLRARGEQLDYEVQPSGQARTVFTSTVVTDTSVVFENLQHDFPQRVAYQRDGERLLAWIEGPRSGQMRRIEYPYKRVACP